MYLDCEEHSGFVVECSTSDQEVAGSSLNRGILFCPWARHFILCLIYVLVLLFVLIDCLCPINNLSVIYGWVFLGLTSTKLGLMCLAQGHNAVTLVRLEPAASRSLVKHSTTEPLRSNALVLVQPREHPDRTYIFLTRT